MSGVDTEDLKDRLRICIFPLDNWYFDDSLCQRTLKEHFHVNTLEGLGLQDYDSGVIAAGALFQYLNETQKTALSHMATIHPYTADKFMLIDSSSRRNLNWSKHSVKNRNEVLFSGYWIRQRQQWVHVHFEVMWNSP